MSTTGEEKPIMQANNTLIMLNILSILFTAGQLICFIFVLVKMFQQKAYVLAVISIFCGLPAFIWGWMKAGELQLKKVMIIWTLLLIVHIIMTGIFTQQAFSNFQTMMKESPMVAPGLE